MIPSRKLALLGIAFCLQLSACQDVERSVRDAVQQEAQRQIENAGRNLERGTREFVDQNWQHFRKEVETFATSAWTNAKQWLGFEAPVKVGVLAPDTSTTLDAAVVKGAFVKVYQDAGGARVMGEPNSNVTKTNDILIQTFKDGDGIRSAILMNEMQNEAHFLTGKWLEVYESQGGTQKAGFPVTNPTNVTDPVALIKSLGAIRGERQLFTSNNGLYALMHIYGTDSVTILPPKLWQLYTDQDLMGQLGFPLSSYPLDDQNTKLVKATDIEIFSTWAHLPYHVIPFQNGSITFDPTDITANNEITTKQTVNEASLILGLSNEFKRKYLDLSGGFINLPNSCTLNTIKDAQTIQAQYWKLSITNLTFSLVKAALVGLGGIGGEITIATLTKSVLKEFVLSSFQDRNLTAKNLILSVTGVAFDTFFAKTLNDFAAQPLSAVSSEIVKTEYERVTSEQIAKKLTYPKTSYAPDQPSIVEISFIYDPRTRFVWGVITSDCDPQGIFYQFRVDTYTGELDKNTTRFWDGNAIYIDIATNSKIQ